MGFMQRLSDGLVNLTSKLGVPGDKAYADTYALPVYTQAELEAAYRSSWLARKIVDVPPFDMVREWRDWQAEDDQIELIEAEEKRLGLQVKVKRALTWARLYGGSALILGVKDGNPPNTPLDPERIKAGALQFVHAVTRYQLGAGEIDRDPMSPGYGAPKEFTVSGSQSGNLTIHPSRVIRFVGQEIPEGAQISDGWGDPIWTSLRDPVRNADLSASGIATLVHEAKIDVVSVPGLAETLSTSEGEQRLLKRFALAAVQKSVNSMMLLDGGTGDGKSGEQWERKEISFAHLPDVLKLFLAVAAGAADIPATRLLGKSPDGMNSTGDADIRNYYDMLASRQELELWPALEPLDNLLIRSAIGSRPDEIYFESAPLWQMTPDEKSKVDKAKAETVKIYADSGLLPSSALAKGVQNMLVEDATLPGLEAALEEATKANELSPIEEEPSAAERFALEQQANAAKFGPQMQRQAANDAEPRTLYVRRNVTNAAAIIAWAKAQGFKTTLPASDLHVTIAFSRQPVDWMKVGEAWTGESDGSLRIKPGGARLVERLGDKGAVVLLFNSSELSWRHEAIKREAQASWDFDDFQPHVTITYDAGNLDLEAVEPYRGAIELGPEIFEEVQEDWEKGIREN